MRRWLFRILTGTSLLLCVAIIALWIRSYGVWDLFTWQIKRQDSFTVRSARGMLEFRFHRGKPEITILFSPKSHWMSYRPAPPPEHSKLLFGVMGKISDTDDFWANWFYDRTPHLDSLGVRMESATQIFPANDSIRFWS